MMRAASFPLLASSGSQTPVRSFIVCLFVVTGLAAAASPLFSGHTFNQLCVFCKTAVVSLKKLQTALGKS